MSERILNRLRDDHRNINGLLRILGRQLTGIRRGDRPDYRLMYDIVHYLTYYPDRFHHPFEDVMFARLIRRRPEFATLVDGIEKEHQQIATEGCKLRVLIGEIIDGLVVPRDALLQAGAAYVNTYRVHMQTEEDELFDALADSFQPADWMVLTSVFHWQPDPVFSGEASREYSHLRDCISAEGAGTWPWNDIDSHTCAVCSDA